jgi:cytochrome c oxidase assembly factor CtaG
MTQHELLMLVAAPLLVLGRPLVAMAWGLPRGWRAGVGRAMHARPVRSAWHALSAPLVAWGIHGTAIWLWHAPRLFEATERSEAVHALEHASFLLTALLFWWAVLHHRRRAASDGAAIALLVTTMIHTSVLGALITFAPGLWYRSYVATTAAWGFLPLEDQQLAGLIMWIPGGISYLVAALALFARMLRGERTEPSATRALLRPSTSPRTTP